MFGHVLLIWCPTFFLPLQTKGCTKWFQKVTVASRAGNAAFCCRIFFARIIFPLPYSPFSAKWGSVRKTAKKECGRAKHFSLSLSLLFRWWLSFVFRDWARERKEKAFATAAAAAATAATASSCELSYSLIGCPTGPFTSLEPFILGIDVSELHKISGLTDIQVPKLWMCRSGDRLYKHSVEWMNSGFGTGGKALANAAEQTQTNDQIKRAWIIFTKEHFSAN